MVLISLASRSVVARSFPSASQVLAHVSHVSPFAVAGAAALASQSISQSSLPLLTKLDPAITSFALAFGISQFLRFDISLLDTVAWRYFLPASVATGILGSSTSQSPTIVKKSNNASSAILNLGSVLVAFIFGTIGSLCGGWACMSYFKRTFPSIPLQSELLKVSAGLTSSYIGGTANFFETVTLLQLSTEGKQLLNLIAVADIAVMILYFAALSNIHAHALRKTRRPHTNERDLDKVHVKAVTRPSSTDESDLHVQVPTEFNLTAAVGTSVGAIALSWLGHKIQSLNPSLPGIPILFVTTVSSVCAAASQRNQRILSSTQTFQGCSSFFLLLFYASLGQLVQLRDLRQAHLSLFVPLFGILLGVHLVVLQVLTSLWNGWCAFMADSSTGPVQLWRNRKWLRKWIIDTDTMLIASNACVGGSATAVSMATSFHHDASKQRPPHQQRQSLVIAACAAGILGYVLGTPLALLLYKVAISKV